MNISVRLVAEDIGVDWFGLCSQQLARVIRQWSCVAVIGIVRSTDAAAAKFSARPSLDLLQDYFIRLGWSHFHFYCVLCRQSRAVKCISNRCQLDRISHVVVGRHLQKFACHPIGNLLDALPRFAFHLWCRSTVHLAHARGAAEANEARQKSEQN